jgi:hypothetical protein
MNIRSSTASPQHQNIAIAVAHVVAVAVAVARDFAAAFAVAFALPGAPAAAAETAGITPKGRRTWMCVVFCRDRKSRQKIPPAPRTRRARRRGVLSFGYFSLHKQRKVTRSAGAKAFAVEVEVEVEVAVAVAVAFDNKQKHEEQRSKLRSTSRCHLHERPWIFDPRPSGVARWRSAPREPVARKQRRFAPACAETTVERWR